MLHQKGAGSDSIADLGSKGIGTTHTVVRVMTVHPLGWSSVLVFVGWCLGEGSSGDDTARPLLQRRFVKEIRLHLAARGCSHLGQAYPLRASNLQSGLRRRCLHARRRCCLAFLPLLREAAVHGCSVCYMRLQDKALQPLCCMELQPLQRGYSVALPARLPTPASPTPPPCSARWPPPTRPGPPPPPPAA